MKKWLALKILGGIGIVGTSVVLLANHNHGLVSNTFTTGTTGTSYSNHTSDRTPHFTSPSLNVQVTPPSTPLQNTSNAPFDAGLTVLLAAGIGAGLKRSRNRQKAIDAQNK